MGRQLEFHIVDVFTDVAFAGNPLAVVLGADGLNTAQLQLLARQFQLSESAFPMAPTAEQQARGVGYRLRIFTTTSELPFAGHPSVGTAWLMAQLGRIKPGRIVQECGAGELPLVVAPDGGSVELTGGTPWVSGPLAAEPFAAALGLTVSDLAEPPAPPRCAGTGLDYVYLLVRPEALAACRPDVLALRALAVGRPSVDPLGCYVVAWDQSTRTAQARMFADDVPGGEDPATGSAALGLGVWLVASGLLPGTGPSAYTVLQGIDMGRPSTLRCSLDAADGVATVVRVSGRAAAVAHGWIEIPVA